MKLIFVLLVTVPRLSSCTQIKDYGTLPFTPENDLEEVKLDPLLIPPLIEDKIEGVLSKAEQSKIAGLSIGVITNLFALGIGAAVIEQARRCDGEYNCPDSDLIKEATVLALAWTGGIAEIICTALSAHFDRNLEFITKFGIGYLAFKIILFA